MVVVGADHGGVALKDALVAALRERGEEVVDVGTSGSTSVDYPDFARLVAARVSRREAERGILVCTSGIGMSIVANKFPECAPPSTAISTRRAWRASTTTPTCSCSAAA